MKQKLREVVVLQHVPNEGAGTLLDYLKFEKIPVRTIALYRGDSLPDPDQVSAALIMGGPMNVYQEKEHPFLKEENVFIKKLIEADTPCFGVCLGSQLIAKALGFKVYKAKKPEIGWQDVSLSAAAESDPVFSQVHAKKFRVLQWHEDTFDLPAGATLLASSGEVPHQAYRYGECVYGLQFHVEVDRPMIEDWFQKSPDLGAILREHANYRGALKKITDGMYKRFFDLMKRRLDAVV